MADLRFYDRAGPFRLGDLAQRLGAAVAPGGDPDAWVLDVAGLAEAGPGDLSYFADPRYDTAFTASAAGFCLVAERTEARTGVALLVAPTPQQAFAAAARLFYPDVDGGAPYGPGVDPTASLGEGVLVGGGAVIGPGAELGPGVMVEPGAVIGRGCVIGAGSRIGAGCTISHAVLGQRVTVKPGARIGQAGFGFANGTNGAVKMPQLGRTLIEDDVEIGANTTVDRGAMGDTVIGAGTKLDNQVQVAHNVRIGRSCLIAAQIGISGSSRIDDYVVMGGQVGVGGHIKIGKGARVAAKSGIFRDIEPGAEVGGFPAVPVRDWHRQNVALARLGKRKGSSDGR